MWEASLHNIDGKSSLFLSRPCFSPAAVFAAEEREREVSEPRQYLTTRYFAQSTRFTFSEVNVVLTAGIVICYITPIVKK